LGSAGVSATADTGDQKTNCSVWSFLFSSLKDMKGGAFVNSRDADPDPEIQNSRDYRSILESDSIERFVIKKEFNVRTVKINCSCNRDVQ
jgi:hypothetical protein